MVTYLKLTTRIAVCLLLMNITFSTSFGIWNAQISQANPKNQDFEIPNQSAELTIELPVCVGDSLVYSVLLGTNQNLFNGSYRFNITQIDHPTDAYIIFATREQRSNISSVWSLVDEDIIIGNISKNSVNWTDFTLIQHEFFFFSWLDAISRWGTYVENKYMSIGESISAFSGAYMHNFYNSTHSAQLPGTFCETYFDSGISQMKRLFMKNTTDSDITNIYDIWILDNSASILSIVLNKAFGGTQSCIPFKTGDYITYNHTRGSGGTILDSVLNRIYFESEFIEPSDRFSTYILNNTYWDENQDKWINTNINNPIIARLIQGFFSDTITTSSSLYQNLPFGDFLSFDTVCFDFRPVSINYLETDLKENMEKWAAWLVESNEATGAEVLLTKNRVFLGLNLTNPYYNLTLEINYNQFGYPEYKKIVYLMGPGNFTTEFMLLPENTSVSICDCNPSENPDIDGFSSVFWIMGITIAVVTTRLYRNNKRSVKK